MIKHGQRGTRIYRIWKGMRSRCNTRRDTDYRFYGAKGVKVCAEWSSFTMFRAWALAHGYTDSLTIDRINPFGDYEPGNCRWTTMAVQRQNTRRNWRAA